MKLELRRISVVASPINTIADAPEYLLNTSDLIQPEPFNMINAGFEQVQGGWQMAHDQQTSEQAFLARYLEIHAAQACGVRDELDRLRGLIDDAYERLMESFDAIGALVDQRGDTLPAINQNIARAVGNAVSALQFQDMATQLLGHTVQRIEVLERITQSLGRMPQASVEELTELLGPAGCTRRSGPVEQASMSNGSVALF